MKNWKILIFIFEGIGFYTLMFFNISIPCFFKLFFSLPCPGCGMTRAFLEIFHFNFVSAFSYNILAIPLFLYLLLLNCLLFYDTIFYKNKSLAYLKFTEKYSLFLILFLTLSWIVNIFRGV